MKSASTIATAALLLFSVTVLAPPRQVQVAAHLSHDMIERAIASTPLHHQKRQAVQASHAKHRRHHAKAKRGNCSARSTSSSADDEEDSDTTSGDDSSSGSSSSGSSASGSSATVSSKKAYSTGASTKNKSASSDSSSSSSGSSSSSSSSDDSSSSSDDDDVSPISGSSSSGSSTGSASSLGSISGFSGTNTGIGSWFRTNSGQDSTNGRSWCQLNYQDSWMGFAPSVGTMLKNFGGSTEEAGKAYCGREVKATNPKNGKSALIYIVDGFDDKWVKTPGSIDLTVAAFTALYGSFDGNKNTVISGLEWEFTGNVNEAYTFNAGGK